MTNAVKNAPKSNVSKSAAKIVAQQQAAKSKSVPKLAIVKTTPAKSAPKLAVVKSEPKLAAAFELRVGAKGRFFDISAQRVVSLVVEKVGEKNVELTIDGESGFTTPRASFFKDYKLPTDKQIGAQIAADAKKAHAAKPKSERKAGELSVNEKRLQSEAQLALAAEWKKLSHDKREKLIASSEYAGRSFKDAVAKYVSKSWADLSEALRRALKEKHDSKKW